MKAVTGGITAKPGSGGRLYNLFMLYNLYIDNLLFILYNIYKVNNINKGVKTMGADLKNWSVTVEGVTAEDMKALAIKAGECGLSIGSLLGNFINDLVYGAATNGSDERMYAQQWFDRCGFSMFPEKTFLRYLIGWGNLEDVLTAWKDVQGGKEEIKEIKERLVTGEMVVRSYKKGKGERDRLLNYIVACDVAEEQAESPECDGERYSWKDIMDSEGKPVYASREAWEAEERESLEEITEYVEECREDLAECWKEYMEEGAGDYRRGTFDEEMEKVLEWAYKNREFLEIEIPYQGIYKSVIQIKPEVSEGVLNELRARADRAFCNRAGTVANVSSDPYRLIYQGGEKDYGCLELGMLELEKDRHFLSCVGSWLWIDEEEPGESCDVLETIKEPVK